MPTALASPHAKRLPKAAQVAPAGQINYYEGGRRLIVAKARQQELKLKQLEGELVYRKAMDDAGFACARQVRDNFANLPDRLSGILAAESDQQKVHDILTKELQQCLEGLAG